MVKYILLSKPMQLWFLQCGFISPNRKGILQNSWISQLLSVIVLWLFWKETLNENGVHHWQEILVLLMQEASVLFEALQWDRIIKYNKT